MVQETQILKFVQRDEPSTQEAIDAVINAEGDLDLAAERLYGYHEGQNLKTRLVALLSRDKTATSDLQRALRTLTMLQTFQSLKLTGVVVDASLEKLDAEARTRFYTALITALQSLTDDKTQTINANSTSTSLSMSMSEQVFKDLPPAVQQALKVLQSKAASDASAPDREFSLGDPPPNAALGEG